MIRFWVILLLLMTVNTAHALDAGLESNRDKRIEREKSLSTKNTEEQRSSSGNKKSNTTTTGTEHNDQQIIKELEQKQNNSVLDITLPLDSLFLPSLAMLETSTPKFNYRLLSNPRQAADFGLSAIIQPGVIDGIKADMLIKAASSNGRVTSIGGNDAQLRIFRNNLALYGITVGQAYLNLSTDLASLKTGDSKDKDGNIVIKDLGYQDLLALADAALQRAMDKITDSHLNRLYQTITKDQTPCRFAGSTTELQCGSATMSVSGKPILTALGITIYGPNSYAGFAGNYKISSGWSYDLALEKLKTTTQFRKMAEEASKYADRLTTKGKVKDAILLKKLALSQAKSGKTSLALGRFVPGL